MLTFALVLATLFAVYWFWIRPVLKSRPAFHEFYEQEGSFIAALRAKLKGIKQKLSSAFVIAASAAVSGHDFLAPIVSDVDVSSIASRMPSWAWPLVVISLTALFQFLRSLADKRHVVELVDATAASER
jgi:hypothetical protein